MAFGLRSDRFPFLLDYEAALRRHDSIKPKQGKNEGIRPLAERSRNSLNIRKVGEAEDLVIRLYGTDIITYRKNGEIVVNFGLWDSCTTRKTISAIAPCTLHRRYNQTWLTAKNGSYPIARRHDVVLVRGAMWNGEFLEFSIFSSAVLWLRSIGELNERGDEGGGYTFSPALTGYHYINPEYPKLHKLNRPVFNLIKKQHYQPFIDYIQTALSLRNNLAPTMDEAEAAVGEKYYEPMPLPDLMDLIHSGSLDNPESWYVASVVVLRRCMSNAYRGWEKNVSVSLARLKRELKDMICTHHRDEVFTSYEVRDGRVVKDVNAKYFM
jgi:hypothetical protein